MKKVFVAVFALLIAGSCTRIGKSELELSARSFLNEFREKLKGPEEGVLSLFAGTWRKKEILKALAILQNKDSLVIATILFDSAEVRLVDSYAVVDLPVELAGGSFPVERTQFSFHFFKNDGKLQIGLVVGEALYQRFSLLKDKIEHAEELARRVADLKVYYDRARELQKDYDTVVWYVHHKNMTYYFAVRGSYNFDSLKKGVRQDFKMGLLDEMGKVMVPVEYERIGNPSLAFDGAVEVIKDGKAGYFNLDGREMIPAVYEWLVPYEKGFVNALAKKDSTLGWLDKDYVFHEKFPTPEAERFVNNFEYLTKDTLVFDWKRQNLINVLYPLDEAATRPAGVVIHTAYTVKMGLFTPIDAGYITHDPGENYNWGNAFSQVKIHEPFSLTDLLSGFITEFKSRFIGGRGEFYNHSSISMVDSKRNFLGKIWVGKDFKFAKLNDTLYQYSSVSNLDDEMGPGIYIPEYNFPEYGYFSFTGRKFDLLKSNRRFAFTEFVKLDSSYLTGNFETWDGPNQKQIKSTFLSNKALETMRDEILASYGFVFTDPEKVEMFKYFYKASVDSYDEVYSKASAIDKYNLDFLARIIGPYPARTS